MPNVCLFLEGTYPYVSGGVSHCVHQLITMLPQTSFQLVYIGASPDELLKVKYKLPPNVVGLSEVFLFSEVDPRSAREQDLDTKTLGALRAVHEVLHHPCGRDSQAPLQSQSARDLHSALQALFPVHQGESQLFQSLASMGLWNLLNDEYERLGMEVPFIDFFYTWRSAHLPIYRILNQHYPKADIYHSMCTGYAGLAAASAAQKNDAPCFITEHGIYAHERAIEISESDWFYPTAHVSIEHTDVLKTWWMEMFRNISRWSYGFASEVITLYEGNRTIQLKDGAPADRTRIIPNGIDLKYKGLRRNKRSWTGPKSKEPFHIGFIGRIVSIKDVKTVLKSVRAIYDQYPNIKVTIAGNTDEDPDYSKQCQELAQVLELQNIVDFVGRRDPVEIYAELDCLLLTSISEAQPLVVLEANCAGVPVVCTEVGSCRELVEGRNELDRIIGPSGLLAPIANCDAIATQVLKLINSAEMWENFSTAGIERVTRFYDEIDLISRYDVLYREHAAGVARVSGLEPGVLPWQA